MSNLQSVVTMDVKPWDDETDMKALEAAVRSIDWPGLVWGGSKLVEIGFGIKKLQINIVVEDELVSTDELQETIQGFEDYVQSTDIAAMQSECPLVRPFFVFLFVFQNCKPSEIPRV